MPSAVPPIADASTVTIDNDPPLPRSPSPPPAAPTPSTLTTPSPRLNALNSIFSTALTHVLQTCSYANFAACFPVPARAAPQILESVWRQVTRMLEEKARREFDEILAERDVAQGLIGLEAVVRDAKERKKKEEKMQLLDQDGKDSPVIMHTLPPDILVQAHLQPYLKETGTRLAGRLDALRAENEALNEQIEGQRREVEELVGGLEALVKDLEGANAGFLAAAGQDGGGALGDARAWRLEAEEVDREMRDE